MKTLAIALATATLLGAPSSLHAKSNTETLHITDLKVLKADSALTVNFRLDPA